MREESELLRSDTDSTSQAIAFSVSNVSVKYSQRGSRRSIVAVDQVNLIANSGETLALVGESGSGKTTLGRVISGLETRFDGEICLLGSKLRNSQKLTRNLRQSIQVVFQDPSGSMDPRQTVFSAIAEPLISFGIRQNNNVRERVVELLNVVGLSEEICERLPHQLSGGQRQRVAIARALASNPSILVLDEPVSALDLSVQAQIVNLLLELQEKMKMTYLIISHDLSVVQNIAHKVAVMYQGSIVELGPSSAVLQDPQHPYTQALISAIPDWNRTVPRIMLGDSGDHGLQSSNANRCRFLDRCWLAKKMSNPALCISSSPELQTISTDLSNRLVACHLKHSNDAIKFQPEPNLNKVD